MSESKELVKRSSYSDFIGEAERIPRLREGLEAKLMSLDMDKYGDRVNIIKQARIMYSDLHFLFTQDERFEFEAILERIEMHHRSLTSIETVDIIRGDAKDEAIKREQEMFTLYIEEFLAKWNDALVRHNLALQIKTERGEIEELYRAYNIYPSFYNQAGVRISPQMETLCRFLYVRAKNNWDNVIIVDGDPGVGKSSFVYAAATTLAHMFNSDMNLRMYRGLIFKESREYCQNLIKEVPQYYQLWFDEAGNQFSKRSFWVTEQSDLINDVALSRFRGFTLWLLWGDRNLLDSDLKNYRATLSVTIKERGEAIVRQFNENPHSTGTQAANPKQKNKVITTPHEAQKLLEQDFLTRLIVPYFDPVENTRDENWKAYLDRKDMSQKTKHSLFTRKAEKMEDFIRDFLISIDKNYLAVGNKINTDMTKRYSRSTGKEVTVRKVAGFVAAGIGTGLNRIFINDDYTDVQAGYITLTDSIIGFIERLKAEQDGIKKQNEERDRYGG